jgi:nucleoside-diphosphate-sugar epimerase
MTIQTTAITGALGHLGWAYLCHLARHADRQRLYALDVRQPDADRRDRIARLCDENPARPTVDFVTADLTRFDDPWTRAIGDSQSVIHFAAVNPFPSANWAEATASMDITANVMRVAARRRCRLVFASSNHVMGRYKDAPLSATIQAGGLTVDLPPAVGSVERQVDGSVRMDSTIYAVPKLMGERLAASLAAGSDGDFTAVSVRIGCCKPGWSGPHEIAGGYAARPSTPDSHRDQRWAEDLWLSVRDFCQLFDKAQAADARTWPAPAIVVNGMSNNSDMAWSLDEGQRYLDYAPVDDVRRELAGK